MTVGAGYREIESIYTLARTASHISRDWTWIKIRSRPFKHNNCWATPTMDLGSCLTGRVGSEMTISRQLPYLDQKLRHFRPQQMGHT